jgi:hypothetical protein
VFGKKIISIVSLACVIMLSGCYEDMDAIEVVAEVWPWLRIAFGLTVAAVVIAFFAGIILDRRHHKAREKEWLEQQSRIMTHPPLWRFRDFVKDHFGEDIYPTVHWRRRDEQELTGEYIEFPGGWVDKSNNIIYLDPDATLDRDDMAMGKEWDYSDKELELFTSEQFFVALLRGMAHLKAWEPLEKWLSVRERLEKAYPDNKEMQVQRIGNYLVRESSTESERETSRRVVFFSAWLRGDELSLVEFLAANEFMVWRGAIRGTLTVDEYELELSEREDRDDYSQTDPC